MWRDLPRRKRLLAITAGLAVLFLAGAGLLASWLRAPEPEYRPGEEIEGLTAELARELPPDYPRVSFTDVTAEAGIRFQHFQGRRSSQLPEDMGSGAAWGDYDNDGWADLFIVNEAGPITLSEREVATSPARAALYRNEGDGTFREVAEEAGVAFRGWGMGAAWGDYDNDGWIDLVVTAYGRNVLYRNRGDGTFADVTREAGMEAPAGFWTGASWGDYDRDGDLDLYITGYVRYRTLEAGVTSLHYEVEEPASLNPSSFDPERNLLYRNEGDGTFTEVAEEAGVADPRGKGLAAAWSDLDEDGWPDLYVANDVSDNVLYRNRGDGSFEDISHRALVADYRGAMGLALGDWNGDGDTDLFITHWIAQENAFYDNKLRRGFVSLDVPPPNALQFMDEADRYGLGQIALDFIGWGTSFVDYDNDGRSDLFVVNGSTFQRTDAPHLLVPMRDQLFWNRGPEDGFFDVSAVAGPYFQREYVGRGAAFADYDQDGDVDVLVVNNGGPAVLLRNDGETGNRWVELKLVGTRSNRQAIGARVRLLAGGAVQVQEVGAQSSYLSQNSTVLHFGLGQRAAVDSVEVLWPSGLRQRFRNLPTNRILRIVEGQEDYAVVGPGAGGSGVSAAGPGVSGPDREQVLRFWEVYRRATRLRVAGRTEEAAAAYADALALNPSHEDALYYLGSLRLELGDFAGAEKTWRRLIAVNPQSGRAHAQLGRLYSCLDPGNERFDPVRAEAELRRALEIYREQTGPLVSLGLAALLRGELAAAEGNLEAVVGTDRASVAAHYLRGYIAWKRGDAAAARELFAEAVEAARPEAPAAPLVAEGETKSGARPLLAEDTRCREVETQLEDLRELAARAGGAGGGELARERERMYRALDALLERARRLARDSREEAG